MNKSDKAFISAWSRKIKAIEYLGGKCVKCGNDNVLVLSFHHKDPEVKEHKITSIRNYRWSTMLKELESCEIMCVNCHQMCHIDTERFNEYKDIIYSKNIVCYPKKPDMQMINDITRLYVEEGRYGKEIGKILNCPYTSIYRIIKEKGLIRGKRTAPHKHSKHQI